jgi:hypothetical protein
MKIKAILKDIGIASLYALSALAVVVLNLWEKLRGGR